MEDSSPVVRAGILYDYVELVEPADPPEGAGLVAIERWKTASKKYEAANE